MTKIILAFPCMGKTYFAQNNPDIAIDIESSDYFFDKTGYEHLTSEQFKGIKDRKPNPNGLDDYIAAVNAVVNSGKYEYVFVCQTPDVVKRLIDTGYDVHYVYNNPAGKQIWTRTEKDGQRAKQQAEIDEDNRKAEEARLAAEKQAKAKAAAKKSQDNLQKAERTNKLKDVDAAVSKAERTKDKSQVAYAHVKVSELSDVLQQDYLTRLNKIK